MKPKTLKEYLKKLNSTELKIIGPFFSFVTAIDLNSESVVYVDAGAQFKKSSFGFSVGDGDSYPGSLDEKLPQIKDFSDFAYVLQSLTQKEKVIELLGFLGGRRDQELMNLAEVHGYLSKLPTTTQTEIGFDEQVTAYSAGEWEFNFTGLFSLFIFEKAQVQLSGFCKYEIKSETVLTPLSSHGLSNQGSGLISLRCNRPVFIFKNQTECVS